MIRQEDYDQEQFLTSLSLSSTLTNILMLQVGRDKTAEEAAADIEELLGGNKPDVTIECSGVEASIR